LVQLVREKKTKIMGRWFQVMLDAYPQQSRFLIGKDSDHFANPIGYTLNEALEEIFAVLAEEKPLADIQLALERLVKLRAVQDTSAQEQQGENPLAFLLALKKIVREFCGAYQPGFTATGELLALEDRMDQVLLQALAIFSHSKEKLLELQVSEMRNKTFMLRRMAGEI